MWAVKCGVGGVLRNFHTYVGLDHFLGFKIWISIFWVFFKKMKILGVWRCVDIFWRSTQNWTSFRNNFYAFYGLFLGQGTELGIIFWVAKISNIFWGWMVDAGPEPTYDEKMREPHLQVTALLMRPLAIFKCSLNAWRWTTWEKSSLIIPALRIQAT